MNEARFSRYPNPIKTNKFRVELYLASNDLHAMVEVISMNEDTAAKFVKRTLFAGKGWQVTKVTKVEPEL